VKLACASWQKMKRTRAIVDNDIVCMCMMQPIFVYSIVFGVHPCMQSMYVFLRKNLVDFISFSDSLINFQAYALSSSSTLDILVFNLH